jgi:hypothetical protein
MSSHARIAGFTGTKQGMTEPQRETVWRLMHEHHVVEGHHGDCNGADVDFHRMLHAKGALVHVHPPSNPKHRAFVKEYHTRQPPKDYLVRNRAIVDSAQFMIATPRGFHEELRSGTWAAIRYSERRDKEIYIVWPDGSVN